MVYHLPSSPWSTIEPPYIQPTPNRPGPGPVLSTNRADPLTDPTRPERASVISNERSRKGSKEKLLRAHSLDGSRWTRWTRGPFGERGFWCEEVAGELLVGDGEAGWHDFLNWMDPGASEEIPWHLFDHRLS